MKSLFGRPGHGLGGKGVFGPFGGAQNVQVFGPGGGPWIKPAGNIKSIQIIAAGPGSGAYGGTITQSATSGIPGVGGHVAGAGGGFVLYTPSVALVPASVALIIGTHGIGGAGATGVGSLIGNQTEGAAPTAPSGPTNVGAGVIVCQPGGAPLNGQANGGTAACTNAWGGSSVAITGGNAGANNNGVPVVFPAIPTPAQLQAYNLGSGPGGQTSISGSIKGTGGGGVEGNYIAHIGGFDFRNYCAGWGGGPAPGAPTNSGVGTVNTTGNSQDLSGNIPAPGGNFSGGAQGQGLLISVGVAPPANVWLAGPGGNAGPGGGGGLGGCIQLIQFANPGTMTGGNGGNGGDGIVIFLVTFF